MGRGRNVAGQAPEKWLLTEAVPAPDAEQAPPKWLRAEAVPVPAAAQALQMWVRAEAASVPEAAQEEQKWFRAEAGPTLKNGHHAEAAPVTQRWQGSEAASHCSRVHQPAPRQKWRRGPQEVALYGLRGVRIGEALHPGPVAASPLAPELAPSGSDVASTQPAQGRSAGMAAGAPSGPAAAETSQENNECESDAFASYRPRPVASVQSQALGEGCSAM